MNTFYLRAYLGAFITFCVMDGLWLGVLATDFYYGALGELLLKEPNWPVAIVFYLGYIAGIVYFAIRPSLGRGSYFTVFRDGAMFGLMAYATYDMTNMATLKGWSLSVAIVDIFWGIVITGTSSIVGYKLACVPPTNSPFN
ncbi:MAG: hypothetical protein CMM58_05260 [Rhodospirillaceae bacterium]|nr:hypothetical protein [Rhodospirillaceae bacterium]|tara:strand:+ start:1680 stop:2102 length:423 start_codon:yes stop_codon:yes gene_type:complete